MRYEIKGDTLPVVITYLSGGETVYTQSGGMAWMSGNIKMDTNMKGGLLGGLKRAFTGESMFMTFYSCQQGEGMVAFASSFPGEIRPVRLEAGQSIVCQKDAFLCAEESVKLEIFIQRKLGAGFFGGEGFILQKLTGPGLAFVELDGKVIEYELQPDQVLKVDTGHVAMFEPTVSLDIEMVRGFRNIFFGGEGLFLTTLRGPGKVWLQTMPLANLVNLVAARHSHGDKE
ncbi:MAG: TIGR00266 family protein [Firmicutes bacterium]|nr:TIGR00266 family protein [Bacillota bacterium]